MEKMKVINPGRDQEGWAKEKECTGHGNGGGGCGAILLVEEEDIYKTFVSYGYGSSDSYRTFQCPQCGVETGFKNSEIPTSIWSRTDRSKHH